MLYAHLSTGALLKAAFICAGIVHIRSELSLCEQLLHTFGGGFELHTWSELPHGSGLGEWILAPCCSPILLQLFTFTCDPLPWPQCSIEGVGQDWAWQRWFMPGTLLHALQAPAASWQVLLWLPCSGLQAGQWARRL